MYNKSSQSGSVMATLRGLVPQRKLDFLEALRIAELQAARFRELTDCVDGALPESSVATLPRIRVVRRRIPTSGMSYWNGREWIIALNAREPEPRQRFTLLHEYKHLLDHGSAERLYHDAREREAEQAADYFAGCVLMPKRLVKRAWTSGHQTPESVAEQFDVSARAAEVRLAQIGLTDDTVRCQARVGGPPRGGRYFRLFAGSTDLLVGA